MGKCLIAALLSASVVAQAGTLITNSDKGLQFGEAFSVLVNGKDKVLALGPTPKIAGPIGKLSSVHLTLALLQDV